ncbi:muconolactone delta-isomerase [Klebsiella pneumoniae]|uniref:Muconolactone delta-isomerase n=1 Tax=Klebsiella pneumoniae TaxID=573 RepID=A0A939SVL6_KLEPN|nr:muconolactone delta-isomerase [Klebsiella pneumoniae]
MTVNIPLAFRQRGGGNKNAKKPIRNNYSGKANGGISAGLYANVSIFDVQDAEELHQILMGLPLYPFMAIKVEALCRHPSSIRDDDR